MNSFKMSIVFLLLVCTSCGDDTINYPEKYSYSNIEMDDCLYVFINDSDSREVEVSENLRISFESIVRTNLQELANVPGSGLFECIELLDESTAKVSATVNGQLESETGTYNMDEGMLTISNENIILERNGNNLEFYLRAYLILPGLNGAGSPFANIANFDTEAISSDLWDNFNKLNDDNDFIPGDTLALCLPRLVFKK